MRIPPNCKISKLLQHIAINCFGYYHFGLWRTSSTPSIGSVKYTSTPKAKSIIYPSRLTLDG